MKDDLYSLYGKEDKEPWYYAIPAMVIAFIPLLVHGKLLQLTGDYYKYWNGSSNSVDFFSYYKSWSIVIMAALLLILFIVRLLKKDIEIKRNYVYIPLGIYTVFVILSAIFSRYGEISALGFVERYEGALVICAYMIIFFVCTNLFTKKSEFQAVVISIVVSAVIIGTIGIFQYFGHDFLKTSLGHSILVSKSLSRQVGNLQFNFGAKIIYATLYHYNYVGSFMAMLFPMTFAMGLLVKRKFYKIVLALVSLLMFLNLILCHSRAGIIGGVFALVIMAIVLRKFIFSHWKYAAALLLLFVLVFVGFNKYSGGMLGDRIGSLLKDGESIGKDNSSFYVKDIYSQNGQLKVKTNKFVFNIVNQGDKLVFKDDNNKPINFKADTANKTVALEDNKYKDVHMVFSNPSLTNQDNDMEMDIAGLKFPISIENGVFEFKDDRMGNIEIKKVDKFGFEGKERLGSARGYIWSRGIPLVKHSMILGYGPDTFAAVFPQTDFIGKIIAYSTPSMLVDKAHNLYLQQAVNTGFVSLIAFLAIMVMYFVSSIKLYFRNEFKDFYSVIGFSIFTAVCGYLGAGFFNDSVVSVAPIFWILLGIGTAANCKFEIKTIKE
ncbi:O-antigen ligase family protein [Clostridium tyrobutyricum]|uniref:O-antigen ligase family protein n=1 Tax=Clostridium tyrobutyricum TaxID=1519 RepID=UPI002012CF5E|nr:O-antigen ligase family protein [Clostridium tyrobutyricum]MBR9647289.1 O-antigen ligase family protein [Clostridium tyrobutyricum]